MNVINKTIAKERAYLLYKHEKMKRASSHLQQTSLPDIKMNMESMKATPSSFENNDKSMERVFIYKMQARVNHQMKSRQTLIGKFIDQKKVAASQRSNT